MSFKRALIHLLDRHVGRRLLGMIATHFVCRNTKVDMEVLYTKGLWTHRVGSNFFPDGPAFNYVYGDPDSWTSQIERYDSDATEYWLQFYIPKPGDVIVDIGAGKGEDVYGFSKKVGPTGRVIAAEAHPGTFAILKNFCSLNRLTNVTPLQLALMDKPGTVRIEESDLSWMENAINTGNQSTGIEVKAETFDELCKQQGLQEVNFLKMNIEGAERGALLGMQESIRRIREICIACHDFRSDKGDGEQFRTRDFVEKFLVQHGFILLKRAADPRDYVRDHVFARRDASLAPLT